MAESITISANPPDLKSMQFSLLRDEGLRHIQELGGRIWTNYNLGDPGITILEALCYAITDLGYRTSYSIPDILAQDPNLPQRDIKNFYTARQILPVCPVTFNDYRKLLIDVEVFDPNDKDCPFAGVKNAWIEKSPGNEIPVYQDVLNDKLVYTPVDINDPKKLDIRVLYDVLLEFSSCEVLGDLNENVIDGTIKLYNACGGNPFFPPQFSGINLNVEAEFPRWDDASVDWNDVFDIRKHIKNIVLDFDRFPSGYKLQDYGLKPDKSAWISITNNNNPVQADCIADQITNLLYGILPGGIDNLVTRYQRKVKKVLQIVCEVRKTLMANRNLCEDFYKINALKVEEIALCADIVASPDADIDKIEAQIYFAVEDFLAPTVLFHTIDEMYALGHKTEEIFEGPPLNHGFIDDNELQKADRKHFIHVSDLINIIMDIPGVLAVKSIQIANIPLDNVDNIPSQSVKWCLQLAFDKNYIPRLAIDKSKIVFLKDQFPFHANEFNVRGILEGLVKEQRQQKLHNIPLDLPVPQGTFRNIEDYKSVQEEFPLVYGIGSAGLPANATDLRRAQAHQLKGFLMFYDQLLVDFMAQLAHVKDLFSMNSDKDADGNFIIDKTYFTESLIPFVPAATELLVDAFNYPDNLQQITESEALFDSRRNRFLDHLMARFGEQFTDYAMMVFKISGPKAPEELLTDKLRLLNNYPEISSCRFRAFNYENRCDIWSMNNLSGLEDRISLLTGIDERTGSDLEFPSNFIFTGPEPTVTFTVEDGSMTPVLTWINTFETFESAKLSVEELIIRGIYADNYKVIDANNVVVTDDPSVTYTSPFRICIACSNNIAVAKGFTDYATGAAAASDIPNFTAIVIPVLEAQYYSNPQSNRNNLQCPLLDYFDVTSVTVDPFPDPPVFFINYNLYRDPFNFAPPNLILLQGPYVGHGDCKLSEDIIAVNPSSFEITVKGDFTSKVIAGDGIVIKNSADNDGNYTVQATTLQQPSPGQFITLIALDGTPPLTTNIPLGTMLYNTMTLPEFTAYAQSQVEKSLFEIASRGLNTGNYAFTGNTLLENIIGVSPSIFQIIISGDFTSKIMVGNSIDISDSADNNGTYVVQAVQLVQPSPGDFITRITLAGSPVLTSNPPLGEIRMSDPLYRFQVTDKCSDPIGTSLESDFNAPLAVAIANHQGDIPPDQIEVIDSIYNSGFYKVISAVADSDEIEIEVDNSFKSIPNLLVDGKVRFGEASFTVLNVIPHHHKFIIDSVNLNRKLFPGDSFTIYGSGVFPTDTMDGVYTVKDIYLDVTGMTPVTVVVVDQKIKQMISTILGDLAYVKELEIRRVEQNNPLPDAFIVKAGADDEAVQQMADFFKNKFFSHEGLHIVEHVLLRPKHHEKDYVAFVDGATYLDDTISVFGKLSYMKILSVVSVDLTNNMFFVPGDITAELTAFENIIIKGSFEEINDGTYQVLTFGYTGTETGIKVLQTIPTDPSPNPYGGFIYAHTLPITTLPPGGISVTIQEIAGQISLDYPATISGSQNGVNDGNYHIDQVISLGKFGPSRVEFIEREMFIQDRLLEVNLKTDCGSCKIDDPYSFIFSVILPAWQGRFANQDFRKFFDRSFRLETPAHLIPCICWISCEQMAIFELRYKRWLYENSLKKKNAIRLSNALNALIDILEQLISQYPEGTLHDCNIDDSKQNDIILNRTVLGTI